MHRHSSTLKPHLRDYHIKARFKKKLSMLAESNIPHDPEFKSTHKVVQIDEKWFYLARFMLLVVVARPVFDNEGHKIF